MRKLALALLAAVGGPSTAAAQSDAERWIVRPWFTFDVGLGLQTRECPGCTSLFPLSRENAPTALGPTTALAAGVTLTRAVAVGAAFRRWRLPDPLGAEGGRTGDYYLALVQLSPPRASGVTLTTSIGRSELTEHAFGGGEAAGLALGVGLARRFPARGSVAARVSLDYQQTVSGRYAEPARVEQQVGSYRARMLTLTVGISGLFLPPP
jgi:hypothetical protein